jgi:antitoxin (DNA-binding transcriptional repressor) of toxin-antitoxin stability system
MLLQQIVDSSNLKFVKGKKTNKIGKREFTLHTSKYLAHVEKTGEELVITHQDEPRLRLIPIRPKTLGDLKGLLTTVEVVGDLNDPVLPSLK